MRETDDGQPLILYHASPHDVTSFRPLSHFGTLEAALDRARYLRCDIIVYEVSLDCVRPYRVQDISGRTSPYMHTWTNIAEMIRPGKADRQRLLDLCTADVSDADGEAFVAEIVKRRGYDSLVYTNRHEDPGSSSWVSLDPASVHILRKVPLEAMRAEFHRETMARFSLDQTSVSVRWLGGSGDRRTMGVMATYAKTAVGRIEFVETGGTASVTRLEVLPELRGAGLGQALFERLKWEAAGKAIEVSALPEDDLAELGLSAERKLGIGGPF